MIDTLMHKAAMLLHVASGTLALVFGFLALVTNKGSKNHKRTGKVFFYSMIGVALSAIIVSIEKDNKFLLAIAVFSFYMNYTGYRVLKKGIRYKAADWIVFALSLVAALYMISTLNIVLTVFGAILLTLLYANSALQFQSKEKQEGYKRMKIIAHLGNMSGAYISTVTAFLVVNINFVKPVWLLWLIPTIIGVPAIVYYTKKWKTRLKLDK